MYTCALRPTGVYGDEDELIRNFYKQCVQRGGVVVHGVPEHIEHGRVYVGETDAAAASACVRFQHPRITPAACLQVCSYLFAFALASGSARPGLATLCFFSSPPQF